MSCGTATVKQIISGDTIVLVGVPKGGPPPEKTICLANVTAPRLAMKSQNTERNDEPFAYEAREFLRQLLIGKVVEFVVEYQDRDREHGQICYEGENINIALVKAGLGKVRHSRPPLCAKNIELLREAQESAKEKNLGMWTDDASKAEWTVRDIQWIINDATAAKAFAHLYKNKTLPAIIEFIRDGGCYRAYFPEQKINAQILLSGVHVDAFKRIEGYVQPQGEPFALEAKFFTEVRLLNRDVNIRIEDADDYGNVYGTVIHPNGNIAVSLLRNGFGKIQDWSIRLIEDPSIYRDAQKEAQKQRIRKWRAWQPLVTEGVKEYFARVTEVVGGDCVIVLPLESEDAEEKRLYLASIRCPRMGTRNRADEPWAFDAKEYVRKRYIGKKVTVVLEYSRDALTNSAPGAAPPPSDGGGKIHFVSIYLDKSKPSLNEQLIAEGLAKTQSHKNDDPRAENFDVLVTKENEAMSQKKGVHGPPSNAIKYRINELLGPQNTKMARGFQESLKRLDKIDGIVEHVFNGSRFKIRIPSESLAISFLLGGIRCPQTARHVNKQTLRAAEDFAEEALLYSREHLMQRNVTLKIDTCDRGGNFIGILWRGKDCINVQLVEKGFARLNELGLAPASIRSELSEAEKNAREKRMGLWASPTIFESLEESCTSHEIQPTRTTIPECVVSHCDGVNDVFIRELPASNIERLQEKIDLYVKGLDGLQSLSAIYTQSCYPKVGELVLARCSYDNQWYRAKIESIDRTGTSLKVFYIDFGDSEPVGLKEIYRCPSDLQLSKCPALALHCSLSGLKPPPDMEEESCAALEDCTADKKFKCIIEYVDPQVKKHVIQLLYLTESKATNGMANGTSVVAESVNEDLVKQGLALVNKKESKSELLEILKAAEKIARKAHVNFWISGDNDEDSGDD